MSIAKASRKVNIPNSTGFLYYNLYKSDPEKRVPSPRMRHIYTNTAFTQEQIKNLIGYINENKMTITKAPAKANVTFKSGSYYYNKYLNDPDHNIPIPRFRQNYKQDQKNKFIGYIISDKMNITEASTKAKISRNSGIYYYHK